MANSKKLPLSDADALYCRFQASLPAVMSHEVRVAVGYSGGLDSTVLLHLLVRLCRAQPFQLQAFHLHHGLSPNADAWQSHCAAICQSLNIPFSTARADLSASTGDGLEARARAARYAAYAQLAVDWLALGHHRDDQVETVLYRLARGAGVHGAAGMPAIRPLASGAQVWRPLLGEPRSALLAYARLHDLQWIEDESNASTDYDRNYIRQQLIPGLTHRFPASSQAIARAARHFAEAASLLDALAEQDAGGKVLRLSVARLAGLEVARRRNLLRWFLAQHGLRLDEKQLHLLLTQLLTARQDANPCLRLGGREVHRYREEIWLAHHVSADTTQILKAGHRAELSERRGVLTWSPAAVGIAPASVAGLQVRSRAGGELIRPRVGGPNRPVKLLLQEAGIPPWLRVYWPLLWRDDQLVAVPGIAVAADCQSPADGLWPDWHPADWPDYRPGK